MLKERKLESKCNVDLQFQEELGFNQIIFFINEQRRDSKTQFEINRLEQMFKDHLDHDGISYTCHSSRFYDRLKAALPEIEKRIIKGKSLICFSSNVNKILEDIAPSSFIEALVKVVNPIRNDMSSVTNSFNGSFLENCQEKSIPLRLLSLCSLLIDGCDPHKKSASQPALTISQIIMREYRKRWDNQQSTTQLHLKALETPVPIYIGLKLYATVRSRTLIDKLFHLGICISYVRVLDICDSIASLILEKYEKEKVFVPQMLKLNVFTIIAKDNIDFNA